MNELYENIDDLLAKKFAGELSPEEEKSLAEWLNASPDNARYLSDAQWLWDQVPKGQAPPSREPDTEKALQKVKKQLHSRPQQSPFRVVRYWIPAAAAALAFVAAALFFFPRNSTDAPMTLATADALLTDTLTDGSVITLNRHSGMVIASGFNQKERRVRLSGEGYFKIAPDQTRPFVVEVAQLEVTVVGTAFNVDALTENNTVEVTVTEGKVRLKSDRQTELLLPGESAIYDKASGQITRQTAPNVNVKAWQDRRFVFDNTPLQAVIQHLNAVYNINISLKNKALEQCPLTARFDNQPLERILDILADTFSFTLERNGNNIVLADGQCEGE